MESFWRHSFLCAVAAGQIAARRGGGRDDSPFVAGLLHDIGQLVHFSRAPVPARQALLMSVDSADDLGLFLCEREVMGFDHGAVGLALAQKWALPRSQQNAALVEEASAAAAPARSACAAAEEWKDF